MLTTTVYLHSSKEAMIDKGNQLGLIGPALEQFMYTCHEVKVDLEVDEKTGLAKITHVDDRQVSILKRKT